MSRADSLRRLLLLLLILGFCSNSRGQNPFAGSCGEDEHIDGSKREAVDSAALKFVQLLLGPNASGAYGLLSDAGREQVPSAQVLEQVGVAIQASKPKNVTVQHTYIINIAGKSPGRIVCGTDLSKPSGWESVLAADIPEQAYVLLSADGINNQLAFTVWLVPEKGAWKVQSFSTNVATLADEDSEQLWERARAQKSKGHDFNAALLYAAAAQTTNRGPNLQLGLADSITKETSQLSLPAEIQGQPPFEWKSPDMTFKVLQVGPIAVGGKVYVMIQAESAPWSSDSQVDAWNKKLIAYFKHRFPEYSDVFAGIVVRTNERGTNRGYGTVEEVNSAHK